MAAVDERVVRLVFDNRDFLASIAQTVKGLQETNQAMGQMEGRSGIFDRLKNALMNLPIPGLKSGIEGLGHAFDALGIVATGALLKIGSMIATTATGLVKSLSIDPVIDGWREYELQIQSVQTILANTKSKGEDIRSVNGALDELNTYADKTIYNFAEMTNNIGRFTAAGVGLQDSVNAIKGIANMAAMSGSTSQQASSAMYQLSQAIASGTIRLMDWNSVVNAGMGGEQFQEALKRTARAHGVAVDDMIAKQGSFRDSLQKGWLTADIMNETLAQIAGAFSDAELAAKGYSEEQIAAIQDMAHTAEDAATHVKTFGQLMEAVGEGLGSSWAITWRGIVGDYQQAEQLFTRINNALNPMLDSMSSSRQELIENWQALGGRDDVIEGFANAIRGVAQLLGVIKDAWQSVFPPATAEKIAGITHSFREFTENMRMSEETAGKVKSIFSGLFSVLHIGVTVVSAIAKGIAAFVAGLFGFRGELLDGAAAIGDFLTNLDRMLTRGGRVSDIFRGLGEGAAGVFRHIRDLASGLPSLSQAVEWAKDKFYDFGLVMHSAGEKLGTFLDKVKELAKAAGGKLKDAFANMSLSDAFKGLATGGMIAAIVKIFDKLRDIFSKSDGLVGGAKAVIGGINDVLGGLSGAIKSFTLQVNVQTALTLSIAIGILAASMALLASLDKEELLGAGGAVVTLLTQLAVVIVAMSRLADFGNFGGMTEAVGVLIAMAVAVDLLAIAVKKLGELSLSELAKGLGAVTILLGELVAAMVIMGSDQKRYQSGALTMIALAAAVNILAIAVKKLGDMDLRDLAEGVGAVTVVLAGLTASVAVLGNNSGQTLRGALALLAMASALSTIGDVVKDLGEMNLQDLGKGIGAVVVGIGALTAATVILGHNSGQTLRGALALIAMAGAVKILSGVISDLGNMDLKSLGKGLGAMTVTIGELVAAVMIMGNAHSIMGAASMVIIAGALRILNGVLQDFGQMSMKEIGKSLLELGGSLAILVAAITLMGEPLALVGAAALVIAAKGLTVLADPLKQLGQMSMKEIGKSLLELAGALAILVVAVTLMGEPLALAGAAGMIVTAKAIDILAPSLKQLGEMSMKEIGKSLLELAGALVILAAGGLLLIPASVGFLLFGTALLMIGGAVALAAIGLDAFARVVSTLANDGKAAVESFTESINAFKENAIGIGTAFGEIITQILITLMENTPLITEQFFIMVNTLLDQANENLPQIVEKFGQLCIQILDKLTQYAPQIGAKGAEFCIKLMEGIEPYIPRLADKGADLAIKFMDGIGRNMDRIADKGAELVVTAVNAVASAIERHNDELREAGRRLAFAIADGMTGGMASKVGEIAAKAREMASAAKRAVEEFLHIRSPSRVFWRIGRYMGQGMALGVESMTEEVASSTESFGEAAVRAMNRAIAGLDDQTMHPVITPVIDLDEISAGVDSMRDMFAVSDIQATAAVTAREFATVGASAATTTSESGGVTFNQYNNSPRALSRRDIYRDTKDLIRQIKKVK